MYYGGQWNPKDGYQPLERVSAYPIDMTRNGGIHQCGERRKHPDHPDIVWQSNVRVQYHCPGRISKARWWYDWIIDVALHVLGGIILIVVFYFVGWFIAAMLGIGNI
jgi:hypothetical protein